MKRDVPVVSYRNSTSNHNRAPNHLYLQEVVSYRNSTSNHNAGAVQSTFQRLYLIEILHQTTTQSPDYRKHYALYLIEILHQTTTASSMCASACSCILSKFYIKPQRRRCSKYFPAVVSYRNSTSNHNSESRLPQTLCVVSYRNSTSNHNLPALWHDSHFVVSYRNSTSNHNNRSSHNIGQLVVSYRNSTSNHNLWQMR